nr:photosystem II protein Y [Oculatella sp. LEGE 06141]
MIVLMPILIAGSWAIYNIGQVALKQVQGFLNKQA